MVDIKIYMKCVCLVFLNVDYKLIIYDMWKIINVCCKVYLKFYF